MPNTSFPNKLTSLGDYAPRSSKRPEPVVLDLTQKLLFFFHVPKTGGSSVTNAFVKKFGRQKVLRLKGKRGKGFLVDVIRTEKFLPPACAQNGAIDNSHIIGHFASLSIIEGRESKYHKACFWRHPADWFLSYYNWRNRKDKGRQKRTYSFLDFVKSLSHNPMSQDFLLYCGDVPGWKYFLMSDRRKFECALSIADKFDVFADISRVDDYLVSVGCGSKGSIEYHNTVPKEEKALRSLDPKTRHRLERLNPVDYYIHRIALGQDRAQAIAEANLALTRRFQFRDLVRLITRPYYRLKVKFIPFFSLA